MEVSPEEQEWKRPKLILFNLALTAAVIVSLIMGLASSAILSAWERPSPWW